MNRVLLALWVLVVSGCAVAQEPFPLIPAPSLEAERDVLATVALSQETLAPAYAEALAARHGADLLAVWPLRSLNVLCIVLGPATADADDLRGRMARDPAVLTVEPIRKYALTAAYADDLFAVQDALRAMNVSQAHAHSTGAGVTVALIDSGVATDHPDLAARGVVYRDVVRVGAGQPIAEPHGTAMAALIAADARNGRGIVGVAPDAGLLAIRACWEDEGGGACNSFTLARALNMAILTDARIINMSLGGPPDPLLRQLVDRAVADGRIVIAAGRDGAAFPADVPGVIAAGAGPGRIAAPATDVISAAPDGYAFHSGASVAAAHVSGVAALMAARDAALDGAEAARRLSLAQTPTLDACAALGAADCTAVAANP